MPPPVPLVDLVDDDVREVGERGVAAHERAQEHAVRAERQQSLGGHAGLEADLEKQGGDRGLKMT